MRQRAACIEENALANISLARYPASMATILILPEAVDQHSDNYRRWEELGANGDLKLYENHRIETDRHGHVVMSPYACSRHGQYQSRLAILLDRFLPGGVPLTECPVSTSDGVKLVDAGWMTRVRFEPMREFVCFERAPEICIEVLSASNTRREIDERRTLFFEIGCVEFWTVGLSGELRFSNVDQADIPRSLLCPAFPIRIVI